MKKEEIISIAAGAGVVVTLLFLILRKHQEDVSRGFSNRATRQILQEPAQQFRDLPGEGTIL